MIAALSDEIRTRYSRAASLGGNWWAPQTGGPVDDLVDPQAAPEGGSLATLQDAVNAAIRAGGTAPRRIRLAPGFHEGPVIIPPEAPPLVIEGPGAARATLAAGIDAMMPGEEFRRRYWPRFARAPLPVAEEAARRAARTRIGTGHSAVLTVARSDVALRGFTIRNDYSCDRPDAAPEGAEPDATGRYAQGQHQAVALQSRGADRLALHDMTLESFQDTLYLAAAPDGRPARTALTGCIISGDVDFIFGGGTAHFRTCEIRTRGARGARSWAAAPSTAIREPFGFIFESCRFTHDGAPFGRDGQPGPDGRPRAFLARQWFEGVRATPYGAPSLPGYATRLSDRNRLDGQAGEIRRETLEAVGKCILIAPRLGAHLSPDALWDAWSGPGWSPRFRPAQHSAAEFLSALGPWLRAEGLDYADLDPADPWLAVYLSV
ncbi:pectinesterase family protein [Poseidonocella sedimentorum]|uniref:Pectinesterase n=1 Tax=Poseidonocella sedimentorum TaxID=871652 RepID=A0A1I6EPR8_9RHOB|nr:pectinesterase family protein [Poseidonocella sedimentorum]SFR19581.1 Pectinesterase [Poseidonocella sedimentorum]